MKNDLFKVTLRGFDTAAESSVCVCVCVYTSNIHTSVYYKYYTYYYVYTHIYIISMCTCIAGVSIHVYHESLAEAACDAYAHSSRQQFGLATSRIPADPSHRALHAALQSRGEELKKPHGPFQWFLPPSPLQRFSLKAQFESFRNRTWLRSHFERLSVC